MNHNYKVYINTQSIVTRVALSPFPKVIDCGAIHFIIIISLIITLCLHR